jgi:DNA-directed RNA polymerase specialized sigma24 family protein
LRASHAVDYVSGYQRGAEVQESEEFRDFVMSRRARLLQAAWLLIGDWHLAEDLVQTDCQ